MAADAVLAVRKDIEDFHKAEFVETFLDAPLDREARAEYKGHVVICRDIVVKIRRLQVGRELRSALPLRG